PLFASRRSLPTRRSSDLHGGWEIVRFQDTHYDANLALDSVILLEFVKETQPKNWKRYISVYRTDAEQKFLKRLNEEITAHGILQDRKSTRLNSSHVSISY